MVAAIDQTMEIMPLLRPPLRLLIVFLLSFFALAGPTSAQTTPATAAGSGAEAEQSSRFFATRLTQMREHAQHLAQAVPAMPENLERAAATFRAAAGEAGTGRIALGALACLVAGGVLEWLFRRATAGMRARRRSLHIRRIAERLTRIGIDAVFETLALGVFAIGAMVVLLGQEWPGPIHEAGVSFLVALLGLRLALLVLGLLLRPADGPDRDLAAFDLDTTTARFWYRHLGSFVGWFAFGWAVIAALRVHGMPRAGLGLLAYILGIGLVVIAIAIIWRQPATAPAAGEMPADSTPGRNAGRWLASVAAVAFWLLWATTAMTLFWFLTVAIGLPIAIRMARRAARHVMRPIEGDDGSPVVTSVAAIFVEQGLRAALIVGGIWVLLWGWGLDVGSLAERETAFTRLLRGSMHALIILLVADLAWSLIKALADNALINAQVLAGTDAEETRRRARVRTLLPIGRNIAFIVLVVMAGLMALAALGVEIAPLIASAGVVGVAVGFGAQTVVRDMISGMFYMLDDAFRVGEYIQSGSYKGTVESFSLRSVKLRHQRGPLFTIPFGVLGAVQNMSRDWVIVKDQIGITYDSDVDKAKKIIKQIGLELAKDPDLGPSILQPLKLQGIEQFGEYSINIRMKMMTKPGEQFVIRRKANAMIKKAFDENGIHFAFPTVQLAGGSDNSGSAAATIAAQRVLKPKTEAAQ